MEADMKKYMRSAYLVFRRMREFTINFAAQFLYFPIKFGILFLVWETVYTNGNFAVEYTFEELIGYYFILAIVEAVMMPCGVVAYEEWASIQIGDMNLFMTRPISYPLYAYAKNGRIFLQLITGLFFICFTKIFMVSLFGIELHMVNLVWFVLALILGFTIMVSLFQIIGHITFWVENILSLRDNLWNIIKIFSGEIFPIAMYPLFLQNICKYLPFQYIYFLPISILQGRVEGREMMWSLLLQTGWVIILVLVNALIWKRGNAKYVSQGG